MIYLDNAATSAQKPEAVYQATDRALRHLSGNPGRSGHRLALQAAAAVWETRVHCARLFNAESAETVCFAANATEALNLAIHGLLRPGDHAITTSMEHNSVARPLEYLRAAGVEISKLRADVQDGVDPQAVAAAIKKNTRLVACTHVSNVTGTINDIAAVGAVCRSHGIPFLVDAAQSAGGRVIDVQKMHIDLLAFPGHKGLLGPQGTGGLYVRGGLLLVPLKQGGTGSVSQSLQQPATAPDRYESGTLNVPGIAGLGAGIAFILAAGQDQIEAKETALTRRLLDGLAQIPGVVVYAGGRAPVVSLTIAGCEPQDAAMLLDSVFDIAVRAGLHCAPDAHHTLGTLAAGGTVRLSPNYFTTEQEIDTCLDAVARIAGGEL